LIEAFNVFDDVLDLETIERNFALGQGIEHERIVGIGTVTDA